MVLYAIKELNDLRMGGTVADSLEDSIAVLVGVIYAPYVVFAAVGVFVSVYLINA